MIIARILVNILMIWIFTRIAVSLFKTEESMATPCSVNAIGKYLAPNSVGVSSNKKSSGNRSIFLLTDQDKTE